MILDFPYPPLGERQEQLREEKQIDGREDWPRIFFFLDGVCCDKNDDPGRGPAVEVGKKDNAGCCQAQS